MSHANLGFTNCQKETRILFPVSCTNACVTSHVGFCYAIATIFAALYVKALLASIKVSLQ